MTGITAPQADWSAVGSRGHAVQFYSNDGYLLDLLTRYVGAALVSGDAAIVLATRTHRDGLAKRLGARGFDVAVPRNQGRYVALDARATLAKIIRDGKLDRDLFRRLIGDILGRVSAGSVRNIVAFGELVAVLWSEGKHESAIQLERMWNELAQEHSFSLCCAYPIGGFGNRHAAPFMAICAQHSHVFTVAHTNQPHAESAQGDGSRSS